MNKTIRTMRCLALALAMTLSLAGCVSRKTAAPGTGTAPQTTASAETAPAATEAPRDDVIENRGMKLFVPAEIAGQVIIETPADGESLITFTEKASLEAARKTHPESVDGAGWLAGISRLDTAALHTLLGRDMSGRRVVAEDGNGNYYLLDTPTDVRIEREGEITPADLEQWEGLYNWVNGAMFEDLLSRNGLTVCSFGNSSPEMFLARIAWGGVTDYTLGGLAHGVLRPADTQTAAFAEEILESTSLYTAERTGAPDGEYLYLTDPADGQRLSFYAGEGGSIVGVAWGGGEAFYESEDGTDIHAIVERWYEALAQSGRQAYDMEKYVTAVSALQQEYAALDEAALQDYNEEAHPELPWYTAVIANTVRNSLYSGNYDFNGDGVPELVISAGDDDWQQPMGIYAFDGEKLVYLCPEQALGERADVTFVDGEFMVVGSGGAATGGLWIYRIGADGYSTEILASAQYEYSSDGMVTFRDVQGGLTDGQLEDRLTRRGEFPPIDYTCFAPRSGS